MFLQFHDKWLLQPARSKFILSRVFSWIRPLSQLVFNFQSRLIALSSLVLCKKNKSAASYRFEKRKKKVVFFFSIKLYFLIVAEIFCQNEANRSKIYQITKAKWNNKHRHLTSKALQSMKHKTKPTKL